MQRSRLLIAVLCLCIASVLSYAYISGRHQNATNHSPAVDPTKDTNSLSEPRQESQSIDTTANSTENEYAHYHSDALGITIQYPLYLQNTVNFSDGVSYEGFLSDCADTVNCVYLYPSTDSSYDQDSIIAEIYWIPSGTFGPEVDFGKAVTWFASSDGSKCVCHLPMSAKLGYEAIDCTVPNKQELWNAYDTVEKSILNGEFTVELDS